MILKNKDESIQLNRYGYVTEKYTQVWHLEIFSSNLYDILDIRISTFLDDGLGFRQLYYIMSGK